MPTIELETAMTCLLVLMLLTVMPADQQAPVPSGINIGAQREAAAPRLVALLKNVRRRAQGQTTVQRANLPNSPFTGTQTTLFAFSVGKRTVPVDPQVVQAMDRLLAWKITDPNATAEAALFDEWLDQLMVKASAIGVQAGTSLGCDAPCVVDRMTKLDDTWGGSPRDRPESRDQVLLDALIAAVTPAK